MTKRAKSAYIFFGAGHDYDGPHPWRGTYGATVEADSVRQLPNKRSTKRIIIRDDDNNRIAGTPDDMRAVALAILKMTEPKAARRALPPSGSDDGAGR